MEYQQKKLPVTRSWIVTEDKGNIMGLPLLIHFFNMSVFFVLLVATDNFPLALGTFIGLWIILSAWVVNKPKYFLLHLAAYLVTPRHYSHRPGDGPRKIFKVS